MKYAILIYLDEQKRAAMTQQDIQETSGAFKAYTQALMESGAFVSATGLQSSASASTVRVQDGERLVQDGPYADAKEQLGSIYVVETPDLDSALEWAARCPATSMGVLEVRPLWSQA
ncbi:hypothetical protein CCAX7_009920 [Capsulimonas corticalis]|uniref:Uncharacterized protein n=1 Tax=Capsulimonas corticalis TaxID=2219043 RepID=A0A402CUE9_9BACT|nr:YciI family protein [Capsulimonas corticalis]BDI28941.1 hypothetical protein CCAX7_009920 [Capsulimonas corticalis]